jgi:cobalt-precorrin 5A hydrolase
VSVEDVLATIETALENHGLTMSALSALATTEFKRNEEAIFAAGRELNLPVIVVDLLAENICEKSGRPSEAPPSSGPSGHLLPGGENRLAPTSIISSPLGERSAERSGGWMRGGDVAKFAPSVSEASALAVAGKGARLLGPRTVLGSVTCAIAISGDAP